MLSTWTATGFKPEGARFFRNKTFSGIRTNLKKKNQNSRKIEQNRKETGTKLKEKEQNSRKRNKTQGKGTKLKKKRTKLEIKGTKLQAQDGGGAVAPFPHPLWQPLLNGLWIGNKIKKC